jgi:hypothetical protein
MNTDATCVGTQRDGEFQRRTASPGHRELARRAHYLPTTLARAAGGENLPSLAVTPRICDIADRLRA